MLLLLWGFYALRAGDLKANLTGSTDGVALPLELEDKNTVEGLIITFVWAYTDADQAFGAFFGAISLQSLRIVVAVAVCMLFQPFF